MRAVPAAALAAVLAVTPALFADLTKAKAEPNLEKRSKLALDNAMQVFQSLRDDYSRGDSQKVVSDVQEINDSVQLAYDSLKQTGKDPRKSPGSFKRAELETRDLARRLDSLEQDMSLDDRAPVAKLKADVQKVHDDLLLGLLEGKKK
jgi:hypothetical protein